MEWQPIETARKGEFVLVCWHPKTGWWHYASAVNQTGTQWWSPGRGAIKPKFWMPLPHPPTEGK